MSLDHLSFDTHGLAATRCFYSSQLDIDVISHEQLLMAEGESVGHMFLDFGYDKGG